MSILSAQKVIIWWLVELRTDCFYQPKRSFGQGNVFTGVCDSVHRGGVWSGGVSPIFRGGGCLLKIWGAVFSKFSGGCLLKIFGGDVWSGGVAPIFRGRGLSAQNFGGGCLLQIWGVSAPNFGGVGEGCLLQIFGGGLLQIFGGGLLGGCGLLLWPSGLVAFWLKVVFCFGGLLLWWPSGLVWSGGARRL